MGRKRKKRNARKPEGSTTTSRSKTRIRRLSGGVVVGIISVVVAIIGVTVAIWIDRRSEERETAQLKHFLLIQPLDLQQDGYANRWEVILGTMNSGPAAVEKANTYIALSPTRTQIVAPPQVLDRPPLTPVEFKTSGAPREISFAFEDLAPQTGFSVRMELVVTESYRDRIEFTMGDPDFVANFIQFVGTNGVNLKVDYSSMSSHPIPTLDAVLE